MKRITYAIIDEKKNALYCKVGTTTEFFKRLETYNVHNAEYKIISVVETYGKTKHHLETAIHAEMEAMGFIPVRVPYTGKSSEWFTCDYDSELAKAFTEQGLKMFKACENRKVIDLLV